MGANRLHTQKIKWVDRTQNTLYHKYKFDLGNLPNAQPTR